MKTLQILSFWKGWVCNNIENLLFFPMWVLAKFTIAGTMSGYVRFESQQTDSGSLSWTSYGPQTMLYISKRPLAEKWVPIPAWYSKQKINRSTPRWAYRCLQASLPHGFHQIHKKLTNFNFGSHMALKIFGSNENKHKGIHYETKIPIQQISPGYSDDPQRHWGEPLWAVTCRVVAVPQGQQSDGN